MSNFNALGLSPTILKSVTRLGFETPTPIQVKAIPLALAGHDLMGLAQTGTGKTAAFGLPLVHHLLSKGTRPAPKEVRALILAPTRELVNQIADNLRSYVRNTHLRINCVVGGTSINTQTRTLGRGSDILVATPGRLLDLVDRKAVHLNTAEYLVLDEADQMLDLGFIHALRRIASLLRKQRQTLLFSATMPKQIEELSKTYLQNPKRVETTPPGKAADKVRQSVHFVSKADKPGLLRKYLAEHEEGLALVFARTKHGAEKLMKGLVADGFSAASIHGNKSQNQRDRAINGFRKGSIRILVATDVAARGIDIPGVGHVYNYDLPEVPENYVHRIGRTARAGRTGEAIAFCSPEEFPLLTAVEKLMNINIHVAGGALTAEERASAVRKPVRRRSRRSGSGRNRRDQASPAKATGALKKKRGKRADANRTAKTASSRKPAASPARNTGTGKPAAARPSGQKRRYRKKSAAA